MNINEKIMKALEPIKLPVYPDRYEGQKTSYYTFNYVDDRASGFGDDIPTGVAVSMQIHLFLPRTKNYMELKKNTRDALFRAGFTFPEITELINGEVRHLVFECEIEEE